MVTYILLFMKAMVGKSSKHMILLFGPMIVCRFSERESSLGVYWNILLIACKIWAQMGQ